MDQHTALSLALSPSGKIHFSNSSQEYLSLGAAKVLQQEFSKGYAYGVLYLGVVNFADSLPPSFAFWQRFSRLFITRICHLSRDNIPDFTNVPLPQTDELQAIIRGAPFMVGVEYLNLEVLGDLWQKLITTLASEIQNYDGNLQNYLSAHNSSFNLIGRVCFHLAENKSEANLPFAFLATYTDSLQQTSGVRHLPLGNALKEYAGAKKREALLTLLLPVQKAASQSKFISNLVETRDIFHPLAWSSQEAYQFLHAIPAIESSGVVVRVPNWWSANKPSRPKVSISIGQNKTKAVGMDALLDFSMTVALSNGERLTQAELEQLLNSQDNLVKIKGQWVEIDQQKLAEVLKHWQSVQKEVDQHGLTFAAGLRLLAGIPSGSSTSEEIIVDTAEWSTVTAGNWLLKTLKQLRNPGDAVEQHLEKILNKYLNAVLRPYQVAGVKWLWLLYNLKLGGCLADDMGLGKTIQVLTLLLLIKYCKASSFPHLLVVPASLLSNWQEEILRFTPSINFLVIHSSVTSTKDLDNSEIKKYDLIITTYGFAQRLAWLKTKRWDLVVLDEAQTIKNPQTKQTRAVKALKSNVRFILSGTPIENRLLDLWSLFDFTAPGLLGTGQAFLQYGKKLDEKISTFANRSKEVDFLAAIRSLVSPYILRRLKNDKSIIADLPDKTELKGYCSLTKHQVGLYQKAVEELAQNLRKGSEIDGIKRRGLILSYILRFKQICNHPSQLLGHGAYDYKESGKFLRLKELCEEIAAKQEKVLIFTQFREIIPSIADFLAIVFDSPGLIMHGATAVKKRAKFVEAFQQEEGPPFFVLSLKAGGTGLNLTRAAHVVHFDRWWNPAVENQATDRAYRIGQKKNVLVHKFICRGTIEEKIDNLIESKKDLSNEILSGGAETLLTEMSNEELMRVVSLDVNQALAGE